MCFLRSPSRFHFIGPRTEGNNNSFGCLAQAAAWQMGKCVDVFVRHAPLFINQAFIVSIIYSAALRSTCLLPRHMHQPQMYESQMRQPQMYESQMQQQQMHQYESQMQQPQMYESQMQQQMHQYESQMQQPQMYQSQMNQPQLYESQMQQPQMQHSAPRQIAQLGKSGRSCGWSVPKRSVTELGVETSTT